ncbi:MAG: hypothetical protein KKF41_10420 [Actinobacteria bacterium]|nr:hypothetical protein [Actinomycetota bacterium]MBU1943065.1 hypothetical protein [Actinomycetota bacterium]MBU2687988.1 hypothetical protein [Actinomycetota bacterium]
MFFPTMMVVVSAVLIGLGTLTVKAVIQDRGPTARKLVLATLGIYTGAVVVALASSLLNL